MAWLVYQFRAIERILPNLKQRPKHAWVAPVLLCFILLLAMLGFGVYIDGYAIHPPAQFTGICPPPAHIARGGCWDILVQEVTIGTTTTVTTISVPAGTIETTTTGGK